MRPVGFFKALFGSCAGTAIFSALRFNRWPRVIWHLVLLSFLLSLLIASGELRRVTPRLTAAEERFVAAFGSTLLASPDGIRPEKDPERARLLEVEPGIAFAYLGAKGGKAELTAEERALARRMLVIAAPRFFAFAVYSDDQWIGRWQDPAAAGNFRCSDADLNNVLNRQLAQPKAQWETPTMRIPAASIFRMTRGMLAVGFLLMWFTTLLVLAGLYTTIFAVVNRLIGGGSRFLPLTLGEYWKIGIYAGFPAMLVAAAFPAFDLPFLTYPTVYMIGLVVYWMIAASRVSAEILAQAVPAAPTTAEEDDDDEH